MAAGGGWSAARPGSIASLDNPTEAVLSQHLEHHILNRLETRKQKSASPWRVLRQNEHGQKQSLALPTSIGASARIAQARHGDRPEPARNKRLVTRLHRAA
jgi:hypothetical protein